MQTQNGEASGLAPEVLHLQPVAIHMSEIRFPPDRLTVFLCFDNPSTRSTVGWVSCIHHQQRFYTDRVRKTPVM